MHWILRMGGVQSSMSLHFFLKIISALQRVLCTQIYRKYCKNSCSNTKLSESLASSSFAWVFSKSSQPNSTINYLHFVHRPYLEVQSTNSLPGEWISTFSRKSLLYSPLTQLCKLFPVKNTNTNSRIHKCKYKYRWISTFSRKSLLSPHQLCKFNLLIASK